MEKNSTPRFVKGTWLATCMLLAFTLLTPNLLHAITAGCSELSIALGAGEYVSMPTTNGVVYAFRYSNNSQSNGIYLNGSQYTTQSQNFTGNGATWTVGPWRSSTTWSNGASATLWYRITAPTGASVGSTQNRCGSLTSTGLGGNTPSVGSGSWSQVSGPGSVTSWGSGQSVGNTTVTVNTYGNYVFRWTINNGGCTSTADIAVNFGATPTANAGSEYDKCQTTGNTAFAFNTGASVGGSYSGYNWTFTATSGSVGSITANSNTLTPTFTPTTAQGLGTLTLTTTGTYGCTGTNPTSTVLLQWGATPTANAGSTFNKCQATGTTAFTVNTSPSTGGSNSGLNWTYSGGSGTGSITGASTTSTPTFTPTSITGGGTLTLTVTGSYGCTGNNPTSTVALNWGQTPTSNAGSTVAQCQSVGATAFTVNNSASSGGSYSGINWTYGSGTGSASITSGAGSLTPTFTPTSASGNGTLSLTVTGSSGCAGSNPISTAAISWGTTPTAYAGTPISTCQTSGTSPITLSNSASDGGTFGSIGWTYTVGTGTGSVTSGGTTLTPVFTPTSQSGNGTLTLTVNGSGACSGTNTPSTVAITWGQTPTVNAGSTINKCQTVGATAFTLSNGASNGGTGSGINWTYTAGTGTGSITANSTTLTPDFTPTSSSGNGTLTLTAIGTGACVGTNPTSTVAVNWGQTPTSAAGSTFNECQAVGTDAFTINTSASTGGTYSGSNWTYSSGSGTGSITSGATTLTPGFTPTTTAGGGTLTLTVTGSLGCTGTNPTSTVALNWGQTPVVNAGSTVNKCQAIGTTTFTLSNGATSSGSSSGILWTYTAGAGTGSITANSTTLTPTFGPTTTSGNGTLTLTATGTAGCAGTNPSSTVALNWGQTPTANAGSVVNKCQAVGATVFTVNNGASTGGTNTGLSWTYGAGTGTGSITANSTTLTPDFTPTSQEGSGTLSLTVTGSAGCAGTNPVSTVALNWGQTPSANAGSPVTSCATTGTPINVSNGASDGGTFSGVNWTYVTGSGTGSITSGATSLTPTFTPVSLLGQGTLSLTVAGNLGCVGVNATSSTSIQWTTTQTASTGGNQNVCQGGTTSGLGGNTPSVGSGLWTCTAAPGGGSTSDISFASASLGNTTATATSGAVPGDYTLQWTITNAPCGQTSATLTLHVAGQPTATVGASQSLCPGGTTSSLGGNTPPTGGSGLWTVTGVPSGGNAAHIAFSDATDPNATATANNAAVAGNYTLRWTVSNSPCFSANATLVLVVSQQPSITAQPGVSLLCQGGTGSLGIAVVGGVNPVYQWKYFDGSSFVNVTDNTPSGITYGGSQTTPTLNFSSTNSAATGNFSYEVVVTYTAGSGCTPNTLTSTTGGLNGVMNIGTQPNILIPPSDIPNMCLGSSSSFSVVATGGTALSYQWQYTPDGGTTWNNVVNNTPSGITYGSGTAATLNISSTLSATPATYQYRVRVSSLGNNCQTTYSNPVNLTIPPRSTAPGLTPTDVLCNGNTNGIVTVTTLPTGGTSPYQYSLNGGSYQSGTSFGSLAPGAYTVTAKDVNGCLSNVSSPVTVGEPTVVTASPSNDGPYTISQDIHLSSNPGGGVGSYTYSWNGPQSFTSTGANPTVTNISIPNAGTYNLTVTDGNGCTAVGSTNVVVLNAYTWTGINGQDWTTSNNWYPVAPVGGPNTCDANVYIPLIVVQPIINSPISIGSVTMDDDAIINLNSTLSVCKDWTGGSSIASHVLGGELIFNGTSAQSMSGKTALAQLTVNNPTGLNMQASSALDVFVSLNLKTGNFNTTNGLTTFKSNTVDSAAFIDNFSPGYNGTLTGNVTAERFYNLSSTFNQHFMGSPINNASFAQWGASGTGGYVIPITTCDETQMIHTSPYGTVFSYHETHGTVCGMAQWYVEIAGNSQNAVGYSILRLGSGRITLTGQPNLNSSYTVNNLTNSGWNNTSLQHRQMSSGWQLLSNPYLGDLQLTTHNAGFDDQVQVWHTFGPYAGTYQPAIVGSGTPPVLAPFQAFMVHKTSVGGTASYTINGSDRKRAIHTFYSQNDNELVLEVTNTQTGMADKTTVAFNDNATDGFDEQLDANKFGGALNRHTLYTVNDGKWMAVNVLHSINTTSTVPVGLEPGKTGTYEFSFNGISGFDPTSYIILEDKKTNIFHDVRSGNYSFTADSADDWDRFVLHFTPPATVASTDASCNEAGTITVTQPGTANWNYIITNSVGSTVATGMLNQTNPINVSVSAGTYVISLTDNNNYNAIKTVQVLGGEGVTAGFVMPVSATAQSVVAFSNTSVNGNYYTWTISDGSVINGDANPTHTFTQPGTYTVTLEVRNVSGCVSSITQTITITAADVATGLNALVNKNINLWSNENIVYVDFTAVSKVDAVVTIYNMLGQELSNEKYVSSNLYHKEIDNIEAAYVVVSVKNNDDTITKKLFIINHK